VPGAILHRGASVLCSHGGRAAPSATVNRVTVSGQPVATIAVPYDVTGCSFVPPGGNGPCVSGQWTTGATRVCVLGQPVALMSGTSTCAPTGTPLLPVAAQTRAIAT
jgi:hypothetical protein